MTSKQCLVVLTMLCLHNIVCFSLSARDISDKLKSDKSSLKSSIARKQLPSDRSFATLFRENKIYHYFHYAKDHPFNFSANSFALINACWLADASMLAYVRDRDFASRQFRQSGFANVIFFDHSGTHCFIALHQRGVFVIFRGTEPDDIRDIMTDAKIMTVNENKVGKVHSGFKQALDTIWDPLYAQLSGMNTGRKQRCWLFLKNMAHNGALKMFISCTESSHQIARTPVRQTPPV